MAARAAFLLVVCGVSAMAQVYTEGFEEGLGGARSYAPAPNEAQLELMADNAAEGKRYLRCTLPGHRKLEGFGVSATGLSGGRLATVTAQVRGKGEVWLCLNSRNGWLYSPTTVRLSDEWQKVSLSKVLVAADTTLGIYFISQTVQPGAVFEVDDIVVTLAAAPQVFDAQVGPWLLQAEDFVRQRGAARDETSSLNGRAAQADRYVSLAGLPFPRTSSPVSVYVRVRPSGKGDTYRLTTDQGGNTQFLASVGPEAAGLWQWLRFPPLTAGEVGDALGLACEGDKTATGPVTVDAVVISTMANLSDEQLGVTPELFARRPLVEIGRAEQAPRIDGDPTDPCWERTVACTGFITVGSLSPAQEPAVVRLCYDDHHLYALFACQETILSTAQQRRHEFRAKTTQRDGEVTGDDCVILLLDPEGKGRQAYDFTVNALGTVADARDTGPDLWGSRDLSWNSGAQAQGTIGEGMWSAELAIPFADLGAKPRAKDTWQVCIGRLARARKEQTSWNPSNRGLHDPYQWGTLVFGEATPGLVWDPPGALQPGPNRQAALLASRPGETGGVVLTTCLISAGVPRWSAEFHPMPTEAGTVTQRFAVSEEGELRVSHAVLDAATLRPLCLTPELTRRVKSSQATLRLACEGPYELLANDEPVSRGNGARGEALEAPLQRGANVFVLRLEQGTAAVSLEAPGVRVTGERWKMAPADTAGALLAGTDDVSWRMAAKVGEHPQLGPVVGEVGKPTVLRLTLLWEKTRIWPTPEPAYYLARGASQHLNVIVDGLKGRTLEGWNTHLAVPPGFEVVGSSGFYGTSSGEQPKFTCEMLGEQEVQGKRLRVARISADKPVRAGRHYILSLFNVFVRAEEAASEEAEFVYWSEANEGSVVEAPQSLKVRVLPKLQGAQPKRLVLQLWSGWLSNMDDRAMREEVFNTARQAGFNDVVSGDRWTSDHAPAFGLRHTLPMNFAPWSLNLVPYLKEHPEQRLVDSAGQASDKHLCMSLLLADGWSAVEAALAKKLDEVRPSTVDYDFEYPPFTSHHSCYCPRCLQAFREATKLPADAELTPRSIRERYGPQWVDFMARRVAAMFARLKEAIHRLAPGTEFSVYSGYATADNAERYGVDWRYVGELQACDRAGCGYGRPVADIQATLAALKGIPLICGCLIVPYETDVTTPQTPLTAAGALRMLLDSSGGILVYDRLTLDGRTWRALGEVSRLAAEHEDVFLKGRRSNLPEHDSAAVQVVSEGDTTLVCVMNEGHKPVRHSLILPAEAGAGTEFYTGTKVAAGERVECEVEAGGVRVWVLRR